MTYKKDSVLSVEKARKNEGNSPEANIPSLEEILAKLEEKQGKEKEEAFIKRAISLRLEEIERQEGEKDKAKVKEEKENLTYRLRKLFSALSEEERNACVAVALLTDEELDIFKNEIRNGFKDELGKNKEVKKSTIYSISLAYSFTREERFHVGNNASRPAEKDMPEEISPEVRELDRILSKIKKNPENEIIILFSQTVLKNKEYKDTFNKYPDEQKVWLIMTWALSDIDLASLKKYIRNNPETKHGNKLLMEAQFALSCLFFFTNDSKYNIAAEDSEERQ